MISEELEVSLNDLTNVVESLSKYENDNKTEVESVDRDYDSKLAVAMPLWKQVTHAFLIPFRSSSSFIDSFCDLDLEVSRCSLCLRFVYSWFCCIDVMLQVVILTHIVLVLVFTSSPPILLVPL